MLKANGFQIRTLPKGETQYVNVLEIPPVDSPETAVRVSIAADLKRRDDLF